MSTENRAKRESRLIKVRNDLQPYFEVVSHQEAKLRCKLAGQDNCILGKLIKYRSQQGWYNFERHVTRVHNVPASEFGKAEKFPEGKRKKPQRKEKAKETLSVEETVPTNQVDSTESSWENLLTKEKYCIVCQELCETATEGCDTSGSHWATNLQHLFPGCEGSTKLSLHLFSIYFLRDILGYPVKKCDKLLKQCRGRRSPDTWFTLCSICRNVAIQAASISQEIARLESELLKLKGLIESKFTAQVERSSPVFFSRIEENIRAHIFRRITPGISSECLNEENNDGSSEAEVANQDVIESAIKMELSDQCVTTNSYGLREKRRRSGSFKQLLDGNNDDHGHIENPESLTNTKPQSVVIKTENENFDSIDNYDVFNCVPDQPDEFSESCNENIMDDDYQPDSSVSEASDLDMPVVSKASKTAEENKAFSATSKQSHLTKTKTSMKHFAPRKKRHQYNCQTIRKLGKYYECQLCPTKYKCHRSLKEHLEAHELSKNLNGLFDCQHCGFPCPSEKARILHVGIKHANGWQCTLCNFSSRTKRQFTEHLKEHRQKADAEKVDGKYSCTVCNKTFIIYDVLCKHIRTLHSKEIGAASYQCEHCSIILSCKRHLREHIQQTHKKESRYFCEICGKGTLYMSKLRRHMAGHLAEKCYVCEVCGADFNYSETMRNHIKKEHPEVFGPTENHSSENHSIRIQHTCKHCNCEFSSATLLHRHIKNDHKELFANKCDLCGKDYATPQSLRRHKNINHSQRKAPCPYCDKIFPHQDYIRQHYKFCKKFPGKSESLEANSECQSVKPTSPSFEQLVNINEGQIESRNIGVFATTSPVILRVSSSEYHQIPTNAV